MKHSTIVLGLWLLTLAAFVVAAVAIHAKPDQLIIAVIVFALLMALYLMFSLAGAVKVIEQTAHGGEFGLPGLLWIVFITLTLFAGERNLLTSWILAGAILWLPTTLVLYDQLALTPSRLIIGLSVLIVPLAADVALGAQLDATATVLRIGAYLLPVLLVLLTTREQKARLSFWFIVAVAFIWFTIEFNTFPALSLPFDGGPIRYMQLALVVLFLYLLTLAGRWPDLGFTFRLTRSDWREAGFNLGVFSVIAIPFGLITGFIKPSTELPTLLEIAGQGVAIFFFVALPEEILFRGTIHRYLERVLRWAPRATLLLSSIIFGAAHLDNPPNVGYYFILASIAGWFYGRTYLRTGKIVPAAIVHLMVDWIWSVLFAG